jgi:hypothetical protein
MTDCPERFFVEFRKAGADRCSSCALSSIVEAKEALNNRHPPSLRAIEPLAARPKAVAGSNPVLCFSEHFWIAASLRSSQ